MLRLGLPQKKQAATMQTTKPTPPPTHPLNIVVIDGGHATCNQKVGVDWKVKRERETDLRINFDSAFLIFTAHRRRSYSIVS